MPVGHRDHHPAWVTPPAVTALAAGALKACLLQLLDHVSRGLLTNHGKSISMVSDKKIVLLYFSHDCDTEIPS